MEVFLTSRQQVCHPVRGKQSQSTMTDLGTLGGQVNDFFILKGVTLDLLRFSWWFVKWRQQRCFTCTIGVNARLPNPFTSLTCIKGLHCKVFEEHEERGNCC